ncbi:class I SAM-dependent methyltransferase [Dolichospermum circinale]|jgi:SAM-dependent methyltransferase|uniref:class I SAM-dependent methyltransferase n=1 Tax=Dolichospermum circinale TaxID=109265 RepID=UPI00232CE9E1|nr:class I SAM-dependent methyltransferase [Dolichospermum circinale]MDB9450153.1 class I SAM-dependent methyltransferase [Dolichospermum circinale CS-547]
MESQMYQEMMEVEDKHWWFVARRSIIEQVIRNLNLPADAEIFEAGCGTGGNLAMLSHHGRVYGMELNETARNFASDLQIGEIQPGFLPDNIPFPDQNFDLIVLLDVLEHLEEDTASLQALSRKLKPSGWLLITVPAYPWLWSKHDELLHHKRRYLLNNLRQIVGNAGYNVDFASHFNFVLFPLIAVVILVQRLFNKGGNEQNIPARLINQILTFLFGIERHLIGRLSIPFGVSLLLLAQRNQLAQEAKAIAVCT